MVRLLAGGAVDLLESAWRGADMAAAAAYEAGFIRLESPESARMDDVASSKRETSLSRCPLCCARYRIQLVSSLNESFASDSSISSSTVVNAMGSSSPSKGM